MKYSILNQVIKYLLGFLIVYLLLRFTLNDKINPSETLIITTIVMISIILLENLCSSFGVDQENFDETINSEDNVVIPDVNNLNINCTGDQCQVANSQEIVPVPEIPVVTTPETPVIPTVITTPTVAPTTMEMAPPVSIPMSETMPTTPMLPTASTMTTMTTAPIVPTVPTVPTSTITHKIVKKVINYTNEETPNAEESEMSNVHNNDDGLLIDELQYTDYNHLPMAEIYNNKDYEYGYSFLPPEKWYPQPPFPPVCVTNKKCPVCPIYTTGAPVDVKEWNASRRITPADKIKVSYVQDKLNSGR